MKCNSNCCRNNVSRKGRTIALWQDFIIAIGERTQHCRPCFSLQGMQESCGFRENKRNNWTLRFGGTREDICDIVAVFLSGECKASESRAHVNSKFKLQLQHCPQIFLDVSNILFTFLTFYLITMFLLYNANWKKALFSIIFNMHLISSEYLYFCVWNFDSHI